MTFKKGDIIICNIKESTAYGNTFKVKYVLSNSVVVNCPISEIDFPMLFKDCVLYSTLLKELM